MSKVEQLFGKWVLLEPITEDLSSRTSLSLPDEMQKPQNMAKVILKGPDCKLAYELGDLVLHEPSSFSLVLEGITYVLVLEKNIIGKVENE